MSSVIDRSYELIGVSNPNLTCELSIATAKPLAPYSACGGRARARERVRYRRATPSLGGTSFDP